MVDSADVSWYDSQILYHDVLLAFLALSKTQSKVADGLGAGLYGYWLIEVKPVIL